MLQGHALLRSDKGNNEDINTGMVTRLTAKTCALPNSYPYSGTGSDSTDKWLDQSRECFVSPECQVMKSVLERYYDFMFGVLAWEIKPQKRCPGGCAIRNRQFRRLLRPRESYFRFTIRQSEISERYNAAFAQYRGVSYISFKLFTDGHTAGARILQQFPINEYKASSERLESLRSAVASFFGDTAPGKRNERIWILKHALSECQMWNEFRNYPQIGYVAQKYGFNDIELQLDTEEFEVYKNLREGYTLVLEKGPVNLQRASNVQEHIRKVCEDNGKGLLPETEIILGKIDHMNEELATTAEREHLVALEDTAANRLFLRREY